MASLIEQNTFSMDPAILLNVLLVMLYCMFIWPTDGLPTLCTNIDNVTVNRTQSDYYHEMPSPERPGSDEYTHQVAEQLHEILMTQHSTCLVIIVKQVKTIIYTVNS